MAKKERTTKTFNLPVAVPVFTETVKRDAKGKVISRTMPVTMHVKGMMQFIRRAMTTKNQQELLDEYAKFYILDHLGIESVPLVEKKK